VTSRNVRLRPDENEEFRIIFSTFRHIVKFTHVKRDVLWCWQQEILDSFIFSSLRLSYLHSSVGEKCRAGASLWHFFSHPSREGTLCFYFYFDGLQLLGILSAVSHEKRVNLSASADSLPLHSDCCLVKYHPHCIFLRRWLERGDPMRLTKHPASDVSTG
jgi:hypothetical protein